MKKTFSAAGLLLLLCGIIPLFYLVVNVGVIVLILSGSAFILLSRCYGKFNKTQKRITLTVISAAVLVSAVTSAFMVRQAWFRTPESGNIPVIVLGGKVYENGPSLMVAHRLRASRDYLNQNPEAICIVSGGQGADEPYPEAYIMAKYLTENLGIDPARVLEEDKSTNTKENIRYSKAFLNGGTDIAIATDSFHQLRASIYAKNEGLTPYSVISFTPPGLFPAYWVRDMLGVLLLEFQELCGR